VNAPPPPEAAVLAMFIQRVEARQYDG
jgi:hypothetical protein